MIFFSRVLPAQDREARKKGERDQVERCCTFICSSSSMSLRSAGELAATAFFGCSFTTEAFLAKLQVEKVYAWYFTSGRMAQNRYVLGCF